MEVAPSSIDVQDFQFKLHSKLKIFDPIDESNFKCATNLVVAASRYGLVFIGNPRNTLEVIQTKTIESSESVKHETSNFSRRSIPLPSNPSHLSLNCDQTLLAVVVKKNGCPCALIYQVVSFLSQNASHVQEIRLSPTPNVNVLETGWNPTIPAIYTACKEDGSLTVFELKGNSVDINEIPPAAGARCFSWSPKGKQIVVGSANGSLTQYKPDLKAVKAIPSPTLENGPCSVVNVYWLSNYQFVAVYHSINDTESRSVILIVNSPKTGPVSFINYEDICYSCGTLRNPQYYIIYQPFWNVILVASANSMEVGVLGAVQAGEPIIWQQWNQMDSSRAELPLHVKNETFPLGLAFDTGILHQLPWGENQMLPPMPMLHIISHYGILCSFNVINLKQGIPMICSTPEAIPDVSGLSQFITPVQSTPQPVTSPQLNKDSTPTTPNFGIQNSPKTELRPDNEKYGTPPILPTNQQTSFQSTTPINLSGLNNKTNLSTPTSFFTPPVISTLSNVPGKTSLETYTSPNMLTKVDPVPGFGVVKVNTSINQDPSIQLRAGAENLKYQTNVPYTPLNIPSLPTQKINQSMPEPTLTKTTPNVNKKPDSFNYNQTNIVPPVKTPVVKEEPQINDNMYNNMIAEEIKNFQKEFNALLGRCKNIKLNVGTEEEKNKLVVSADILIEFYKELQDITESHVAEVHYLKQALIQSFAWYEDAKSRHRRFIDPNYTTLLVAQDLDPVSEKQLADIQHLIYYIDSQLKLVDEFLDNQWADFQDSCKKHVRGKIEIPLMEPVYQTMVRINAILARQKYVLKDISAKMKNKNKMGIVFPHMNVSDSRIKDVSDIDVELRKLKIDPVDIFSLKCEKIIKTQMKFSKTKENKICSFFTNRQIFHISPKKPKFSSTLNSSTLYNNEMSKQNLGNAPRAVKSLSFEKEKENEFNDTAEANLSSSNIFTLSLDSGNKTTNLSQMLNQKFESLESKEKPNIFQEIVCDNINNKSDTLKTSSATKSETGILTSQPFANSVLKPTFDFNKSIENTSIKSNFASNTAPISTQTVKVTPTDPNFGIGSNDPEKITLNFKNSTAKIIMSPAENKPFYSNTETKTIFNFSQPKSTLPTTDPKTNNQNDKDLNNTLNFGSQLTFGQISTPKAKPLLQSNNSQGITPTIQSNNSKSASILPTTLVSSQPSTALSGMISIIPITNTNVTPSSTNLQENSKATTPSMSITFGNKTPVKSDTNVNPMTTSIFNNSSTATATPLNTVSSTTNIFLGGLNKNSSTASPLLGSTPSTPTSNSFGSNNTTSSTMFGSNVISSTTTTPSTAFGSNVISSTTTTSSIFGSNVAPLTTISSSLFKSNVIPSTTSSSIFGTSALPTTSSSIFGSNVTSTTNTTTSVFGTNTSPSTITSSIFGSNTVSSTTSSGSIFGNVASLSTSIFKESVSTTSATPSIFGTTTPTTTSNIINKPENESINTVFANNSTPTTSSEKIVSTINNTQPIGTVTTTPIAQMTSIFGGSTNLNEPQKTSTEVPSTTSQPLPFGLNSTTSSQNTFSFGNLTVSALSPKTTAPTSSTFSFTLPTTTQQSIFGNSNIFSKTPATASTFMGQSICSPTQTQASTPFGQTTGNIFAQKPTTNTGSVFGQSGASVFGNTATTSSVFGQNSNSLFTTPNTTSSGSIFRQTDFNTMNTSTSSTGSIFGQSTFGNASTTSTANSFSFTQNAPSAFANPSNNLFGAKPSFGQSPAFGQPAVFGNTTPTFGSPTPNTNVFGGAAMPSPQSPGTFGGFGGSPTFGSPANFGQSAFGAPPTFGNSPSFGSPPKVFGSPGGTGGFGGGAVQENSTFANLASQNTVGFGSLAQSQGTPPAPQIPQFSGGSQFSSWR